MLAAGCGSGSSGGPDATIRSDQLPSATSTLRLGSAAKADITLTGVTLRLTGDGAGRIYLTARNSGRTPDRLTTVSPTGGSGEISVGNLVHPKPGGTVAVPAGQTVTVSPASSGITITVRTPGALAGQTTPVTFTFTRAGQITVFTQVSG
jgi:copper(I)-binding protein